MSKIMIRFINAKGLFNIPQEGSCIYLLKESVLEYLERMKDTATNDEADALDQAIKLLGAVGVK